MNIVLIIIAAIGGFWLGRATKTSGAKESFAHKNPEELVEVQAKAKAALLEKTNERKEDIFTYIKNEVKHQMEIKQCSSADKEMGVTRADIEKVFEISSTTAHKYLNQLEVEKKIVQIGDTGPNVLYLDRESYQK